MTDKIKHLPPHQKGILFGVLATVLFSSYVLINRFVYLNYHVGTFDYVATFMVAGGFFAAIGIGYEYYKKREAPSPTDLPTLLFNGLIAAIGLSLFIFGQSFTTAANASFLATVTIVTTIIFSRWLLKETLTRRQLVWLGLMFAGLYMAIVGFHPIKIGRGELFIVGSSTVLGFTNILSKKLMKKHKSSFIADSRLVTGGIFFVLLGLLVSGSDFLVVSAGWWPVLSGFFFWLTIKFFYASIQYLGSNQAIVFANSHPIFTPLAGMILLGEPYGLVQFVGAVLIILSIYFISKRAADATDTPT